jgi:transcriptional regulator with XRE-family HTH domain
VRSVHVELRDAIFASGMTETQLGRRVGRSCASVCRWIQGKQGVSLPDLIRCAEVLGKPELVLADPHVAKAARLAQRSVLVRIRRRVRDREYRRTRRAA